MSGSNGTGTRTTDDRPHYAEVRDVIAELLAITPQRVEEIKSFSEELGTDSIVMIELLVRLERRFGVDVSEDNLPKLVSLDAVYAVTAERAGWGNGR